MVLSELVSMLRQEGFDVRPGTVTRWVWGGAVQPKPDRDGSGRFRYGAAHVAAVRRLLRSPPRLGRPPAVDRKGAGA